MVSFIQQSLELRISKQWFFYSAFTRTKDIKTMVYFIQVTRAKDIKTMISFILQSLELRISKQWVILFSSH
jgi:hypothetical protein